MNLPTYHIKHPDQDMISKKNILSVLDQSDFHLPFINQYNSPKYHSWDKFRHLPLKSDLNHEEIWYLVKAWRKLNSQPTPIITQNNKKFVFANLPHHAQELHQLDMQLGGKLQPMSNNINPESRQTYIRRGIIEESIASSQLEGAHTTRKAAKNMIITKRAPKNASEQMILNNYHTIQAIESDHQHQPLSLDLILTLHSLLTKDAPDGPHRLRNKSDHIVVQGQIGTQTYIAHTPPNHKFVQKQLARLIDYANHELNQQFIHPITRAIFLHFWIGYLHPFTDGNGRLARALFYWYLLRQDYWSIIYIPISTIIKKSPSQYAMSYLNTEQDGLDLNYFYDFNIKKLKQAIKEFESYLTSQITNNQQLLQHLHKITSINNRQEQLLIALSNRPDSHSTIISHSTLHSISRQTASKDLHALVKHKLIRAVKIGKSIRFTATPKLLKLT